MLYQKILQKILLLLIENGIKEKMNVSNCQKVIMKNL